MRCQTPHPLSACRVQVFVIVLERMAVSQRREGAASHPNSKVTAGITGPDGPSAALAVSSFENDRWGTRLKAILHFKLREGIGGQKKAATRGFAGLGRPKTCEIRSAETQYSQVETLIAQNSQFRLSKRPFLKHPKSGEKRLSKNILKYYEKRSCRNNLNYYRETSRKIF